MGMQWLRGCKKIIKQCLHNFYFITIFASILCFGFAVFIVDKIGNLFFSNLTEIEIAVFKQNLLTRINGIFIIYAQRFLCGIIH